MKRVWNYPDSRSGFTLIELIIVVIIIGVLAAIALPQYTAFVERARGTEAVNTIGSIKIAEAAYRLENALGNFSTNAELMAGTLGITPGSAAWTYGLTTTNAACFIVQANRVGGANADGTIIFNYNVDGTSSWTGTHPGAPRQ